jgi:ribosome biogenesis GTPase
VPQYQAIPQWISSNFDAYASRGLVPARVLSRDRERCHVRTGSGDLPAEIAGAFWHRAASDADLPVVGDWVAARIATPDLALIEAVLPRRTCFSRRAAGRREAEQPIAANIDLIFLVMGLDDDFNLRRLERYLVLAGESGAQAVVVLNKADLCGCLGDRVNAVRSVARDIAVEVTSAAAGQVEAIGHWLEPGRTVALLGSSGVGKSTLVNALLGEERQRTAGVRESDNRGRHTTTSRELISLPNGADLIDTPGMRELQLWSAEENVGQAFEDVETIARECRYRDCSHAGEAGCAMPDAVALGRLSEDRLASYQRLRGEARHHEVRTDIRARQREKQKWKIIHKAQREYNKLRERQ